MYIKAKQTVSKAERVQAKMNEQVKYGLEPQPSTSGTSTQKTSPVKSKWEKTVVENLVMIDKIIFNNFLNPKIFL